MQRLFWPLTVPALALYWLVFAIPALLTVCYSVLQVSGGGIEFVGVARYVRAIHDHFFWSAMLHTLQYAAEGTVLLFVPGLYLAWCLSQITRFKRVFRVLVFAPVVMSALVVGLIWKFIYNPNWGLLDQTLRSLHLGVLARPWLGDTSTAMTAVVIAAVWHSIGLWVVLIGAGMERIHPEVLEAAKVDGANAWQEFFRVTLPQLFPVLRSLAILWIIESMHAFTWVYVMTEGGPIRSTEVAATYVYAIAFQSQDIGYATALAAIVLVATAAVAAAAYRVLYRGAFREAMG